MNGSFDWSIVLDAGVGIGVLLVGIAMMIVMIAAARTLGRMNRSLDVVDRQLEELGTPVSQTLAHVGGIADTADHTIARLGGIVGSLENVAGSLAQTAELAKRAISPAIVNMGATISGISAGLRRFVTGQNDSQS